MNCIIIEDQAPAQRILKKYLEDLGTIELLAAFSDPIEARNFLTANPVDLLFLDINLPKISGISFLRSLNLKPQVILTTAYTEYALESYELDVVDYLLKPFSFERFLMAINKVRKAESDIPSIKESGSEKSEHFMKIGYDYVKIDLAKILFLEADGDYCHVDLPGKRYTSSEPLKKWMEYLDGYQYPRIHKSFVVNPSKIQKISGNTVYLENGVELPIGRAYKDEFLSKYLK